MNAISNSNFRANLAKRQKLLDEPCVNATNCHNTNRENLHLCSNGGMVLNNVDVVLRQTGSVCVNLQNVDYVGYSARGLEIKIFIQPTIQKLRHEVLHFSSTEHKKFFVRVSSLRHELLQYKSGEVQPTTAAALALSGRDLELDELRSQMTQLQATNVNLRTRLAEAVADLNQTVDNVQRIIESAVSHAF